MEKDDKEALLTKFKDRIKDLDGRCVCVRDFWWFTMVLFVSRWGGGGGVSVRIVLGGCPSSSRTASRIWTVRMRVCARDFVLSVSGMLGRWEWE